MTPPLVLSVKKVSKIFTLGSRFSFRPPKKLVAVDQVSFDLGPGQTLGLAGESGCGKSTLAKLICCLEKPTQGEIVLQDQPLHAFSGRALRALRNRFQPVFQDPFGSLNPRFSVLDTLAEPLRLFRLPSGPGDIAALLKRVGLGPELLPRYPHQLSGGQRQRLGIARALSVQPELLVADEPLSSLDVSVQAQVLDLFLELQTQTRLSMVFISHDLRVVGHLADHILIMYLGRIMESAPAGQLFLKPRHPYTQALFKALPKLEPGRNRRRAFLQGELPSPIEPKPGCRFYSRCDFRKPKCLAYENEPLEVSPGHTAACCRWNEIDDLV